MNKFLITEKKSGSVTIEKGYKHTNTYVDLLYFVVNDKRITSIKFDEFNFDKIKNLKRLNKQISTILTFQ